MKLKLSYTGQNDLFIRRILKEELFCSFNDKNQEEAHICNHNLYYELAQILKQINKWACYTCCYRDWCESNGNSSQ